MTRGLAAGVALLVGLGALVAAPAPALAGEPTPGTLRVESIATDDYPNIEVSFVAPGALADTELSAADVELFEAGQARATELTRLPPAAQQVVLALDVSGSMAGEAIRAARAAATDFLDQAPTGMHIALVTIGETAEVLVEPTTDYAAVAAAIEGTEAGGRTALYDAVAVASGLFDPGASRRTLVLLADGEDNNSAIDLPTARRHLAEREVAVYAVELSTSATDRQALEQLARPAGMVVTAQHADELVGVFASLARDVGNRYVLTYRSRAHGTTDLELTVRTEGVVERITGQPVYLPPAGPLTRLAASPLLAAVGLLGLLASLLLLVRAAVPSRPRISLEQLTGTATAGPSAGRGERLVRAVETLLRRGGRLERMVRRLAVAGVTLRPGDFVIVTVAGSLVGAAVGLTVGGALLALVMFGLGPFGAKVLLDVKASRRRAAFADQLDDTLQLLAGSLRAGHSLLQAVNAVAGEAEAPTSVEFRRIVNVTRVGQDLAQALDATVERTGSEDFAWVTQAIAIHREVGGDLAEVLDTVGGTIRERNQIRRQVKSLSAEGKLSAMVLMALPIGILVFLLVTNPGYVAAFTSSLAGLAMLSTAALLMLGGGLWLRKLVRIQF